MATMPKSDPADWIPIAGPDISEADVNLVAEAARLAWNHNGFAYHDRFEKEFAHWLGVRHALSTTNCTAALHLGLCAINIGVGDEVILPDLTWIASAVPIRYLGAIPRFADICPKSWCLDLDSVAALIGPKTKAIMAVGLYGGLPNMIELQALADQHGVVLIEDAAEALGSIQHGQKAGSFGAIACFSFHASKTLTTGEGGMVVTSDQALYERMLKLRNHGRQPGDRLFVSEEIGFKYLMSSMQAALGLSQLARLDKLIVNKRRIFNLYHERLSHRSDLVLNLESPGYENSYWMVSVMLDPKLQMENRQIQKKLAAQKIDVRPFFVPLSTQKPFRDLPGAAQARAKNHHAAHAGLYGINLPSGGTLHEKQIDRVCQALLALF